MSVINLAGSNSTINISPWSDHGYVFKKLEMSEQIGDNIATGMVILTSDGTEKSYITEENSIKIKYNQLIWQDKMISYEINGYIYNKRFLENEVHLYFSSVNSKEFSTVPRVRKYKLGIKEVIKSLYPGDSKFLDVDDSELEPDVKGDLDSLDQNGMTDLDFCTRLCRSYRKDSVYLLGLEGLRIKSLNRKPFTIIGESDCFDMDMKDISYYKEMDLDSLSKSGSNNILPRMYGYKYDLVRNDFHSDLLSVYQYNERYTTNLKSRIKLRFSTRMPEFKVGDIVKYENKYKFNKDKKYIVTYANITIDFNSITYDCELSGWEDVTIVK